MTSKELLLTFVDKFWHIIENKLIAFSLGIGVFLKGLNTEGYISAIMAFLGIVTALVVIFRHVATGIAERKKLDLESEKLRLEIQKQKLDFQIKKQSNL